MIEKVLERIGMTERQARFYIAGLKLGTVPATELALKTEENRITTYKTLQDMVNLGYARQISKNKKIHFSMLSPDEILKQQKEKTRALEKSMPEIVGLMKTFGEKPKIMVYEGLKEVKQIYFSFLEITDELLVFVGTKSKNEAFNKFMKEEYIPKKKEKAFKTRAITSSENPFYEKNNFENNNYVTVDSTIFNVSNDIFIYDYNKVMICMLDEDKVCFFVIISKTFHDFMVGIFDLTYNLLSKKHK